MRFLFPLLLLCSLTGLPLIAQQTETNAFGWFSYTGDHAFAKRWDLHADLQVRRDNALLQWEELLVRPAVSLRLSESWTLTAGYTYVRTYPYGDSPDPEAYPEHRPFQQITYTHSMAGWDAEHRLRLEQRVIAGTDSGWIYRNRLRYQLQGERQVSSATYIKLAVEPMLRFGLRYRGRAIDQVRLSAFVGRKLNPEWAVEAGYRYQFGVPRRGVIYETNHILELSIVSEAPLRRR